MLVPVGVAEMVYPTSLSRAKSRALKEVLLLLDMDGCIEG
jgi:hypothetical protein